MPIGLIFSVIGSGIGKVLSAAFTFLTTKPGVYLLMAGLAVGAYWYSGHEGYKRAVADDKAAYALAQAKAETAAADKARKDQIALDKGIATAAEAAGMAKGKAQAITVTITKEVPKYVTVEVDREFPVPCSLVLLHDAAAIGRAPEAEAVTPWCPDGKTASVKASDLAQVIVDNYGIDHGKDAQIEGLQVLARTLAAAVSQ